MSAGSQSKQCLLCDTADIGCCVTQLIDNVCWVAKQTVSAVSGGWTVCPCGPLLAPPWALVGVPWALVGVPWDLVGPLACALGSPPGPNWERPNVSGGEDRPMGEGGYP